MNGARRTALLTLFAAAIAARGQTPPGVRLLADLEYGKASGVAGDKSLLLDLYLPDPAPPMVPVIVFVHGGGWMAGDRKHAPGMDLVRRGYALASVEYRLSQEAIFPAQIFDCKAAIRFLRAKAGAYGLDADHFAAWGHSAGGHLVALLGTSGGVKELEGDEGHPEQSSRLQAVCDMAGPTDFSSDPNEIGKDSGASRLIGCPVCDNPDKALLASPLKYVTKDCPPFLIIHGDHDKLVPLAQARLLHAALTAAGVPSTLLVRPWCGHGINDPTVTYERNAFFDRWLKGRRED
jgi:acetyl esterase/lipase